MTWSARRARSSLALAAAFVAAGATSALAGGPVPVRRDDLPKPIARLHTCVPAGASTQWRPTPERAGNAGVIITVSCPIDGPGVVPVKRPTAWPQLAYYLARGPSGIGAKRLTFPYLNPDGSVTTVNTLPIVPTIGWSTQTDNSARDGSATFGLQAPPAAEQRVPHPPAVRARRPPQLVRVRAIWLVENGETSLIYWAETTEMLRGHAPDWIHPRYTVVLDRRPAP